CAGPLYLWEGTLVRRKVDSLGSDLGWHSLLPKFHALLHQVAQIPLEGRDQALVSEWRPMPWKIGYEVEFLQRLERSDPFIELRITHIRDLRFHQIARAHDLFFRQKDDCVAIGVSAAEKQEFDLTFPEIQDLLFQIGHIGRCRFDFLQLFPAFLCDLQL